MFWKPISTIFTATAIILGAAATNNAVTPSQPTTQSKMNFVCASTVNPPTIFIYTQGDVNLKPIMSWYSEYLLPNESGVELCQKIAQKLQNKYDQGEKSLLAYQKVDDRWKVCLVAKQGQECTADGSEELFSLNANYKTPECVLENKDPKACPPPPPTVRGPLMSIPGGRYKPSWWLF